ncbi:MAG: ABC transporter permease [Comamonas sp. SCN 65-56]|uniref:ABC transporter substrate-binding protein n=1 Tax=Comamonas sp. SCN 65-56 TaxID=1660095 RepID=UPI00086D0D3D|nr:ABC transporter substrate-binding protein [Comamonas sp. SCN 65-56]ODS92612.1 MAG: ABC transporter permease [Comamonas sp. SCN 65-56]
MKSKLTKLAVALGAVGLMAGAMQAQAQDKVKIGYISDLSSLYADLEGKDGATAIQMAIDDFGGKVLNKPIELMSFDHQNKPDLAASKALEWIDTAGLTMIFSGTNSGTALALSKVATEKQRVMINNGAGSAALTNEQCAPYTVHYAYDTVALSRGSAGAVVANGGKSWFFLTADYAFGHAMESDAAAVVKEKGGTVVGAVRHPLNATDFSSFLLQAQNSKAQVLALANAGGDTINAIKAANEFGISKKMKVVPLLVFYSDIHSLGLKTTQGMQFVTSWYWDMNPQTRAFADKFMKKTKKRPTEIQAADYSATMNYLKAVQAAGTTDAAKVMETWRGMKMSDFFASGQIRPDGLYQHDMYLVQVKTPKESKGKWDYYKVIKQLPGAEVFTTKAEGKCPLWK